MAASRTLADWLAAPREGGAWLQALGTLRASLQATGAPIYLYVASQAELQSQLDALLQRIAACSTPAERAATLPLLGVPFVVKDNIDIAGAPITAACPAFAHVATRHATVVQRLLDAGAVWMAKTNLDQFATGLVGTRSPYGAPESVLAPGRISGGSSSGSAVAVARGDVPFALGTDTAGSGRVPAAFNGLVGLKPTPGRVGTSGVLPACRSLDCVSVFAHLVGDAAAVLAVIEGPDASDTYSAFAPGAARLPARLKIGVPVSMPSLGAPEAAAFDAACRRAQQAGHTLVPIDFEPLFEVAQLLYSGPWVAERHAVVRDLLAENPDALDSSVRQVIAQAARYSATDAFLGQYRLRELAAPAQALWDRIDLLLVPTAPRHPRLDEVAADPLGVNAALGQFTNFVNLLGWCALAVPSQRYAPEAGAPTAGITFIGRGGLDAALARFGAAWCGEAPPPPAWPNPACAPTLPIAVVGAHLSGLPLNSQLTDLGATLRQATRTTAAYRLYALPGTTPPKPGLLRVAEGGTSIVVEVWDLPLAAVGAFLALIPSPLSLGSITLEGGERVHGFLCERYAVEGASDISAYGGWRTYLASR